MENIMPPKQRQVSEATHLLIESNDRRSNDDTLEDCPEERWQFRSVPSSSGRHMHRPNVWTIVTILCTIATALMLVLAGSWRYREYESDDHPHSNKRVVHYPSTRSKYKRVQGIGFQIYTGGAPAFLDEENKELNPECIGMESYGQVVGEEAPMLQCYIGAEAAVDDVQKRLQIMRDAVELAFQKADNSDPSILKIFVAPEFFWRGRDGAYVWKDEKPDDPSVCGPVCQLLQGLEQIVAQRRFQDWFFVFGTVIASEKLRSDDPYDYLFYNFAPIYKGYDPAKTDHRGKRFIVPKRYVSSSDFLTPQRHLNATLFKEIVGQELPEHDTVIFNPFDFDRKRYDNDIWINYKDELDGLGYTMIEYDWLMIDGLAVTLEICFDHQMRTALNTYLGDMMTGQQTLIPSSSDKGLSHVHIPKYQAQISIVSSAGMTVTPDSLVLTNGGTIFLQDGLSNATNRMYWSREGCELGLQFDGGFESVQRRAFLSATDIFFEHSASNDFHRVDLYKPEKVEEQLNGSFSAKVYPPQITVFSPVGIAEVLP
jgi:hypothetical protein